MKKLLSVVLCVLMLAALLPAVQPHFAQADERYLEINETNFPDANFRNWIVEDLAVSGDAETGYYMTREQIAALKEIYCHGVSITSLSGIENFTALTSLDCYGNQLTSLDVSKNTALTALNCRENQLTALDVSKNTALKWLYCGKNQLTSLDVSKNTALINLYCFENQLTALDVSKNTALEELYCGENQLTSLDVSKNTALKRLLCEENQLTALDVSRNTALKWLLCEENQLTALDLSNNTELTYFKCAKQTVKDQTLQNDNGVYAYDLAALVPIECMATVTMQDASNVLDYETGIVTFPSKVESFTYLYATGHGDMDVTVNLSTTDSVPESGNNGKCGDNLYWEFDESTGTLTITGSGAMWDYFSQDKDTPWYNYDITSIVLSDGITHIGDGAFRDCAIEEISIPGSVADIDHYAFFGCGNLKKATIYEGVSSIQESVFFHCYGLKTIELPSTIVSIGYRSFACTGLTDIYYNGTESQRNNVTIDSCNDKLIDATWHYQAEPHVVFGDEERYFRFYPGEEIEDLVRSEASTVYNPRLAHFLGVMSLAAYHDRVCLGDYRELGFDNPQAYHYLDNDPVAGYIIGIKELDDGSRLVMVTVRGTQGKSEWLDTNFNVSEHGLAGSIIHNWHDGFSACANAIIDDLKTIFEGAIPTENITYVITGHSLGAATGNLLSVQLLQSGVNNTDIYDYNFACPNVVFADASDETMHSETYNCIRNICNTEDIVPCVPGELTEKIFNDDISFLMNSGYRWKKYGHTNWFMVTTFTRKGAHKMELYVDFLSNEYTLGAESVSLGGGGKGSFSGGAMAGRCPMDMTVLDSDGNPIAGTVGGEKNYYGYEEGEKALIFINGDKKLIYVFGTEDYRVQINATDEGTMDYTTAWVDFHEEEDPVVHDWEQVGLTAGKTFVNEMPYDVGVEDDYLYVVNEEELPTYRVHEDGTEEEVTFVYGTVEWDTDVQFKDGTPYVIADGSPQTPSFIVMDNFAHIIDPSDYDYRYRDNIDVGTASVIVTFKGEYAGTCSGTFEICSPTEIKTQPKAQTVANGKAAKFTVAALGKGVKYQWYYSTNNGAKWTKWSGKTSASVSVTASTKTNGNLYRCEITKGDYSSMSDSAKLTVSGVKPRITAQPKKTTVAVGETATFKVVAAGTGLKYQWYYSKDNGAKWVKWSGKTKASVKVTASAANNGTMYRCVVKNTKGSVTSSAVKMTVSGVKPRILTQPKAVTVKSGKTVKFTVAAAGVGLKYQWQYSKNGGKTWTKLSGKTSATLSFKAAKKNNGWLYRCVVKNDIGGVNSKGVKITVK